MKTKLEKYLEEEKLIELKTLLSNLVEEIFFNDSGCITYLKVKEADREVFEASLIAYNEEVTGRGFAVKTLVDEAVVEFKEKQEFVDDDSVSRLVFS